ncbi:MAG: filamentous hemagglutinin N-terminal domain-containing protein [Phycisphaeraceae bacterium]
MARPYLSEALLWHYVTRRVPTLAAAVLAGSAATSAVAAPQVQNIAAGEVSISQQGTTTQITASNNSIINYSQFNIAANETVQFIQPNAQSRVLNRVNSVDPTRIDGNLFGNGRVYILNPAGIFFGNQAVVNVAELHAAAGAMSNGDFLSGTDRFTQLTGVVNQQGMIQADAVSLLGHRVENLGTIIAPQGSITLAAGDSVYITRIGGVVSAKVDASGLLGEEAGVINEGTLDAQGGQVRLGAGDIYALAIRQQGTVKGKDISLEAGAGLVTVNGSIEARDGDQGGILTISSAGNGSIDITSDQSTVGTPGIITGDASITAGAQIRIASPFTASGHVELSQTNTTGTGVKIDAATQAASLMVESATNFELSQPLTVAGGDVVINANDVVAIFGAVTTAGGDFTAQGENLGPSPVGSINTLGPTSDGQVTLTFSDFAGPPAITAGDVVLNVEGATIRRAISSSGVIDINSDTALDIRAMMTGESDIWLDAGGTLTVRQAVSSINGSINLQTPTLTMTNAGVLSAGGTEIVLGANAYNIAPGALVDAGDGFVVLFDNNEAPRHLVLGDNATVGSPSTVFGLDALGAVRAGTLETVQFDQNITVGTITDGSLGLAAGTDLLLVGQQINFLDTPSSIDLGDGTLRVQATQLINVNESISAASLELTRHSFNAPLITISNAITLTGTGPSSVLGESIIITPGGGLDAAGQSLSLSAENFIQVFGDVVAESIDFTTGSFTLFLDGSIGSESTDLIRIQSNSIDYITALLEADAATLGSSITAGVVELLPFAGTEIAINNILPGSGLNLNDSLLTQIDAAELHIGDSESWRISLGHIFADEGTLLVLTTGQDVMTDPSGSLLNIGGGGAVRIVAQTGIGTATNPIATDLSAIEAVTTTGGVYISNGRSVTSLLLDAGDSDITFENAGEILDLDIELDLIGNVATVSATNIVTPLQTQVSQFNFNGVNQNGGEGQLSVTGDISGFSFDSTTKAAVLTATGSISNVSVNVPRATLTAGGDILDSILDGNEQVHLISGGNIVGVTATAGTSLTAEAAGYIRDSFFTAGTTMNLQAASIGLIDAPVIVTADLLSGSTTSGDAYLQTAGSNGQLSLAFTAAQTLRLVSDLDIHQSGTWSGSTVDIDTLGSMQVNALVSATGDNTVYLTSDGTISISGSAVIDTTANSADVMLQAHDLDIDTESQIYAGQGTVAMMPWEGQTMTVGEMPVSSADAETTNGFHIDQTEINTIKSASEVLIGSMESGPMHIGSVDLAGKAMDLTLYSGSTIDEMANDMSVKLRTDGRLKMVSGGEIGRDPVEIENSPYDALDIEVAYLDVTVTQPGKVSLMDVGGLTVEYIYTTSGDIFLESTGEIIALDVTANSDIDFTAQQGGIQVGRMQASEGVNLNAFQGSITQAAGVPVQQIVAPSTTMNAQSVGSTGAPINTAVNSMTVTTTAGGQNLSQSGNLGSLNLNAGTGSVNLNVQGGINDADSGIDIRAGSTSITATSVGGSGQRVQMATRQLTINADSTISIGDPEGVLQTAELNTTGGVDVRTTNPNARISGSGNISVDQPLDLAEDIPQLSGEEGPEGQGIEVAEPLWVVGEFAERDGWLDEHELLRELTEQWGDRLAFYIEQGLRARGQRTSGVSEEISDQEIRSLIAQGLEYFCQGMIEDLDLGQDAQGQPVATLTLVYELQKNVSNHMTLVQKKRLRTRDNSEPQITPDDLDDLLQLAAERIVDRLIDDAPTGMMGVRG